MTQAKYCEDDDYYEEDISPPRKPGDAPDGGWGWIVMVGSLLCNLFVQGYIYAYPAITAELCMHLQVPEGSLDDVGLFMGAFCLIGGPFVGVLIKRFGCRKVTWAGSVVTCASMLVSIKAPNVFLMKLTHGVLTGLGLSMVYMPSILIVAFWFEYKRALATGFATIGSAFGVFMFPAIYNHLLDTYDWSNSMVIMAGLFFHCAVAGTLFRPLTKASKKGMKRGVIQRGAIMKALIAEKERQRTISNGSLDNCIITKDNRLIKIDKIDLRNKSSSYIHRLKETFGFSSRSLNRSKNAINVPKVVVDPIVRTPVSRKLPKPSSSPPTLERDSGCGSMDSPNLRSKSYEALPNKDDVWSPDARLVVNLPTNNNTIPEASAHITCSERNINNIDAPRRKRHEHKLDATLLNNNVSPMGSGRSINTRNSSVHNSNICIQMQGGSVMTVPSCTSMEMGTIYEEDEITDCKLCRKLCKLFELTLLKSPTFWLFIVTNFLAMFGYIIPFSELTRKALSMGIPKESSQILISYVWAVCIAGRLILGWVADRPWASAVHVNNVCLVLAGLLSFMGKLYVDKAWLSFFASFFGLFTAAFISLRSIMVIEIFGKERVTSAFGLTMFVQGFAMLGGYYVADVLPGDLSLIVVGILLVSSGISGFFLHAVKDWETRREEQVMSIIEIEEIPVTETYKVENCESSI